MNAPTTISDLLRSSVLAECRYELQPRIDVLLDVARVYGHTLVCDKCRKHATPMAGVCAAVATAIGDMIHGWQVLGINWIDVIPKDRTEVRLLLQTCVEGTTVAGHSDAEIEWRTALGLCCVALSTAASSARAEEVAACQQ
jgi:hypothetical protein